MIKELSDCVLIALWTVCKLHVHMSIKEERSFSLNPSLYLPQTSD